MAVSALYRYPVKSMTGETRERVHVDERGVLGDRGYAVLDVETGVVASAKVPRRWAALLDLTAAYVEEPVPAAPLPPVAITFPDQRVRRSDDPGTDAALSAALGRDVRLVTEPPEGARFEELWPDIDGLAPPKVISGTRARDEDSGEVISSFDLSPFGAEGTFFDLSSLHVLTEATLGRLAELAPGSDFDPRRYRPNLVVDTQQEGFVENDWPGTEADLGTTRVRFSFATMRCVMTTLAQAGLADDRDTLRTIARHNRIEIPQIGGTWACAGVYADVVRPGKIAVGDPLVRA